MDGPVSSTVRPGFVSVFRHVTWVSSLECLKIVGFVTEVRSRAQNSHCGLPEIESAPGGTKPTKPAERHCGISGPGSGSGSGSGAGGPGSIHRRVGPGFRMVDWCSHCRVIPRLSQLVRKAKPAAIWDPLRSYGRRVPEE